MDIFSHDQAHEFESLKGDGKCGHPSASGAGHNEAEDASSIRSAVQATFAAQQRLSLPILRIRTAMILMRAVAKAKSEAKMKVEVRVMRRVADTKAAGDAESSAVAGGQGKASVCCIAWMNLNRPTD